MKQFFDFKTMQVVNPIINVKRFFIDPYAMGQSAALGITNQLVKIINKKEFDDYILGSRNGVIINIFPLKLLNMGQVTIEWANDRSGNITIPNRTRFWFHLEELENETIMRITTIK